MSDEQRFRLELIAGVSAAFALYAKCAEANGGPKAEVFSEALKQNAETVPVGPRGDSYAKLLLDSISDMIDRMDSSGPFPFQVIPGGKDVPE